MITVIFHYYTVSMHDTPVTGSPGQRFWPGRVESRVSVSDPVFDPVLSFNIRVYRGVVCTE